MHGAYSQLGSRRKTVLADDSQTRRRTEILKFFDSLTITGLGQNDGYNHEGASSDLIQW
jgi:hypothetical protein